MRHNAVNDAHGLQRNGRRTSDTRRRLAYAIGQAVDDSNECLRLTELVRLDLGGSPAAQATAQLLTVAAALDRLHGTRGALRLGGNRADVTDSWASWSGRLRQDIDSCHARGHQPGPDPLTDVELVDTASTCNATSESVAMGGIRRMGRRDAAA
jgi:hypothetical protein